MTTKPPVIATYEREIRASIDRIWENVLDWEHLPHLHSQAFAGLELVAEGRDGWRARLELVVPDLTDGAEESSGSETTRAPAEGGSRVSEVVHEDAPSSTALNPATVFTQSSSVSGLDPSVEAAFTGVSYTQPPDPYGAAGEATEALSDSAPQASGDAFSLAEGGDSRRSDDGHVASSEGDSFGAVPSGIVSTEVEVRLDRPNFRYVTRTVAGVGEGTEIWTILKPVGERRTEIEVRFAVPGVEPQDYAMVGGYYRELYAKLWDQDEEMMETRQAVLDARKARRNDAQMDSFGLVPFPLGPASELKSRLPLLVEVAGRSFRVADHRGEIVVYSAVCPHLGGPLGDPMQGGGPDGDGCVTCPWHGYRFDTRTGRSADGRRLSMQELPRIATNRRSGDLELVWN